MHLKIRAIVKLPNDLNLYFYAKWTKQNQLSNSCGEIGQCACCHISHNISQHPWKSNRTKHGRITRTNQAGIIFRSLRTLGYKSAGAVQIRAIAKFKNPGVMYEKRGMSRFQPHSGWNG